MHRQRGWLLRLLLRRRLLQLLRVLLRLDRQPGRCYLRAVGRRTILAPLPVGQVRQQVLRSRILNHNAALLRIAAARGRRRRQAGSRRCMGGMQGAHSARGGAAAAEKKPRVFQAALPAPASAPVRHFAAAPHGAHPMSAAHSGLARSVARLPSTHSARFARVMATFRRRTSFTKPARGGGAACGPAAVVAGQAWQA